MRSLGIHRYTGNAHHVDSSFLQSALRMNQCSGGRQKNNSFLIRHRPLSIETHWDGKVIWEVSKLKKQTLIRVELICIDAVESKMKPRLQGFDFNATQYSDTT